MTDVTTETAAEAVPREQVLDAIHEVVRQQAQVAHGEAALASARRRLREAVARLSRLYHARADDVALPPPAAAALEEAVEEEASGALARGASHGDAEEHAGTLRDRIVGVMEASPREVYTPARLAPLVGSENRDSVRNTLLVLAAKGRIEKVGAGQYRARSA